MKCYIDQSGKVENTSKLTIVAFTNGKVKTLKITGREKRRVVRIMRTVEYPERVYIYQIFAALVFLLIKKEKIGEVIIDDEYVGHEPLIKDIIIKLYQKTKLKVPHIDFGLIGKDSEAHKVAIDAFRGRRKADIEVKSEEVLVLFYAKKKGWSSHSK